LSAGASIPAIKEGKLRALAVSSTTPLPLLPEVPPMSALPPKGDSDKINF